MRSQYRVGYECILSNSSLGRDCEAIDLTVVLTGGSRGMGLAAARQLAEKGAHVVIVVRDQQKLIEGLEYIRVGFPLIAFQNSAGDLLTREIERSVASHIAAFPPNQRRPNLLIRSRPRHQRSSSLELGAPGHSMVLRRHRAPDPLHRHARLRAAQPDAEQLLHERLHGPRRDELLAAQASSRRTAEKPGAAPPDLHRVPGGILQLRRLRLLRAGQGGAPRALGHAVAGDEPVHGGEPGRAAGAPAHHLPRDDPVRGAGGRERHQDGPDQAV